MECIALVNYKEAKKTGRKIIVDGNITDMEDDICGVLVGNTFIPMILEGTNDYYRFQGEDLDYQENYFLKGLGDMA